MMDARHVVEVRGLTKRFGANVALAGVDLTIHPGSVHALIGMNGSGKSTLVKVLAGYHRPDEGTITVSSARADGHEDADIAFVHQDLALIPEFSVLENLTLGRRVATRRGTIDWRAERVRAVEVLTPFGLDGGVDLPVAELTRAQATIVAIARALERRDRCSALVLDEPTSTLSASETRHLLEVVRSLAADGLGILFVSHRLREVLAVSDQVTILRNGRVISSGSADGLTIADLVTGMVGDVDGPLDRVCALEGQDSVGAEQVADEPSDVVLVADGACGEVVRDVDLGVGRGEVLGVVGLTGSGVEELGRLLSGRQPPAAGVVRLHGKSLRAADVTRVGFVPADRPGEAVLSGLTARENATITHPGSYVRRGALSRSLEHRLVGEWFDRLAVQPPDTEAEMASLSGGNQQKVIFARWLAVSPDVLVAEEPTQGVDVYAKSQILERIESHAADGLSVVLLSGEPDEITSICDRVVVLRDGRIVARFKGRTGTQAIIAAMQ